MDEILKALPVPAGLLGMITIIVVALIKDRRQDKDSVPAQQIKIIDGLNATAHVLEVKNATLQQEVDEQIRRRRDAEAEAHAVKLINGELLGKVDRLTDRVEELERRIDELTNGTSPKH